MKKLRLFAALVALATLLGTAQATPLSGQYSVSVTATQLDADSWQFTYAITNNNQGTSGSMMGLDGFEIVRPMSATIYDVVIPPSFSFGGYWTGGITASTVWWWGNEPQSVYEVGSTATFSFKADGVTVGTTAASLVTYWGTYYTTYEANVLGPVELNSNVPDGTATVSLLGAALLALGALARRSRRA